MTDSYILNTKIYVQIHADSVLTYTDSYILETVDIEKAPSTLVDMSQ